MAFLSHTTTDEPLLRQRLLSVIEPFFREIFIMNIGMSERSPMVIEAYRRRILTALSRCGWFIVAISGASASSKWVGFEFAWALRYRDHRRILALILDRTGQLAYAPVLRFVRSIDATAPSPAIEITIRRGLERSGAHAPR
jgi:hypothetical protein